MPDQDAHEEVVTEEISVSDKPEANTPPRRQRFSDFVWLNWFWCLLFTLAVGVIAWMCLEHWFPQLSPIGAGVIAALPALAFGICLRGFSTRRIEDRVGEAHPRYSKFEEPKPKDLERLIKQMSINPDDIIKPTRDDKLLLYLQIGIFEILFWVFLGLITLNLLGKTDLPWLVSLGGVVICYIVGWLIAIPWRYTISTITPTSFRRDKTRPDWLPFLQPDPEIYSLRSINKINPEPRLLGTLIGMIRGPFKTPGDIIFEMYGDDVERMTWVPNFRRFAAILNEIKNRLDEEARKAAEAEQEYQRKSLAVQERILEASERNFEMLSAINRRLPPEQQIPEE